jgi:DNA-binding transcriptional MerR regulator
MPSDHDLIGGSDAARLLGVHRSTLTRWTNKGLVVPALKMPGPKGVVLYRLADITAMQARRAVEAVG